MTAAHQKPHRRETDSGRILARNRGQYSLFYLTALLLTFFIVLTARGAAAAEPECIRSVRVELPDQKHNVIKTSWPAIGCWFWKAEDLEPEGYKGFIDLYEKYSPFGLLTTSLRVTGQLNDPAMHDRLKAASEYTRAKGMGVVLDLDVRLAREAFKERYPDELQQIVLLREIELKETGTVTMTVESPGYADHYTPASRPKYYPVSSELLRVYSYKKGSDGRIAGPAADITDRAISIPLKDSLKVSVACDPADRGRTACAMIAVTVYTPAVFAPHLLSYQREILAQYADAQLAGACKDEWGFPGRFEPEPNELWYSPFMAEAYEARRPGHELLRDMLLASIGEEGREGERAAAVNHYMEMNWQRNGEIETDYYRAIKEYYGEDAMSATHPTWYPYPGRREIFKNGLSWWASTRDLAQTDECTPYCARTALAKKWHSPLWYNMFYSTSMEDYDLWSHALGGGRINYHPRYPMPPESYRTNLLEGGLMRAESRVQLLNCISASAIDCPVAVIFGHPSAMNWTDEQDFADVGMRITDLLWKEGFYADLIPSSEITTGALTISPEGKIQYGSQQYEAAVLYHPEYERREAAELFVNASEGGGTALYRVGGWTMDFEGGAFDGNAALPAAMKEVEEEDCAGAVIARLKAKDVVPQTPCTFQRRSFMDIMVPNPRGRCRLIDGTVILIAGEENVTGDPIHETITVNGREASFDAVGVAAVRLHRYRGLEAMAAGGLKSFTCGGMSFELPERADVALWRDDSGRWRGVIQGYNGSLPEALTYITKDWTRICLPEPYRAK